MKKSIGAAERMRVARKRLTRREALILGVAGAVAALPILGGKARADRSSSPAEAGIPPIRNQPDGVGERLGFRAEGLDALADLFGAMLDEELHPGAQLAVFREGELVIELAGGIDGPPGNPVTTETLFQVRSATKAVAAMVMLMLHDRGRFSFDDPVAKHWPGFGQNGKESITIGQLMSHRAGIPDGPLLSAAQMGDREAVVKAVEAMKPIWPPGSANGYHASSCGWVTDELVLRWEGRGLHEILKTDILEPLGVKDFYLGLPENEFPRMAKMVVVDHVRQGSPGRARFSDFLNTHDGVKLPLSWVCGVSNARSFAKLMGLLASEGTVDGRTYFSKETQRLAGTPTNEPGVEDLRLLWNVRWGLGFILGDTPDVYGTAPHPGVLGHAGGSATVAWGDSNTRLSVCFLCNHMVRGRDSWAKYKRLGDAIYGALRQ